MTQVQIFHNPRCSKSRQTLSLIQEKGLEIKVIDYLNEPLSLTFLSETLEKLKMDPINLFRTKESLFKDLGLSPEDNRSREEWLQILQENPKLIERPIVIAGSKAAIGRPPESVLKLFSS